MAGTMASGTKDETLAAALRAETLCEAFQVTAAARADQVALRTPDDSVSITYGEAAERVRRLAAGFAGLGLGRGDTLGIMLVNRPEFHLVDCAAMHLGATPFSIYNTSAPEQIAYLFGDAGNRIVVTERQFLDRVRAAGTPLDHVVVIDGVADGTLSLQELEAAASADFDFEAAWRSVEPADVLTLIYTSGTTGPPKGVELTHANLMAEIRAVQAVFPTAPGGRAASFLPSAHIADRWYAHYSGLMVWGFTITSVADPTQLMAVVAQIHPTVFGSVPRIWEKVKAGLEASFAAEPDDARRQAMDWAIETGLRKVRAEQAGEEVGAELAADSAKADELVLSKLRAKLGLDQSEWFVVGAAPTPRDVLEFYAAIGIPICELWGMSELSCAATVNRRDRIKIGTVGLPLPGVELRIADDGELLCRGEIVMKGYRNQPEKTAETIDAEGWLHTGDVATIDEDGYVRIVDRKKELIINAAGKNISPANIEAQLKQAGPLIGQACVIGDARPYNVALLVLDPEGAAGLDPRDPDVVERVQAEVDEANAHMSRVEQIKRFRLLDDEWLPGGEELTPTMKLKRKPIAAKYEGEIEALYA
jgi:long-subunit acyl-CoA synthetase (AMP-forming)